MVLPLRRELTVACVGTKDQGRLIKILGIHLGSPNLYDDHCLLARPLKYKAQNTPHTEMSATRHLTDRSRMQLLLASCPNSIQSSLTYSVAYSNERIIKLVIKEDYFQTKISKQHVFINQSKICLLLKKF